MSSSGKANTSKCDIVNARQNALVEVNRFHVLDINLQSWSSAKISKGVTWPSHIHGQIWKSKILSRHANINDP
jgi:hypothetical protein